VGSLEVSPSSLDAVQGPISSGATWRLLSRLHPSNLRHVADPVVRGGLVVLGALFLHDAVWWTKSWFFGKQVGGWWKRRSQTAQTLYRISLGFFGVLIVMAGIFGTILRP